MFGIDSVISQLARSAGTSAADLLGMLMTWWLSSASAINVETPVIGRLHQLTLPLIGLILVVSVLVQGARMALSRRKEPAIDIAMGLMRYALVTGLGLTLVKIGLDLGDDLSQMLLQESLQQFTDRIRGIVTAEGAVAPFLLLGQSLLLFVLALIQWVILFFRQAGILVLSAMLPLAASGAINGATRGWLSKIVPWIIGLVAYKPIAAFIYALGMSFVGQADDFSTLMAGILILVLAIVALPVMMRFFSWSQVTVTGGASSGSVAAGAATGAASVSAMRSARSMDMTGPGSTGTTAGGATASDGGGSGSSPALARGGGSSGGGGLSGGGGGGGPSGGGGGGGPAGGGPAGGGGGGGGGGGPSGGGGAGFVPSGSGSSPAGAGAAAGSGSAAGGAAAGGGAAAAGGPAAAAAAQGAQHVARTARSVADQATSPPDSGGAAPSAGPSGSGGSHATGPSGSGQSPRR